MTVLRNPCRVGHSTYISAEGCVCVNEMLVSPRQSMAREADRDGGQTWVFTGGGRRKKARNPRRTGKGMNHSPSSLQPVPVAGKEIRMEVAG